MSIEKNNNASSFPFGKENYTLMFIGLGVIILGFILMSGGKSADPKVFNESEIYSTTRITIAPILVDRSFGIKGNELSTHRYHPQMTAS